MLLDVRHVTRYHYDEPVRESVMELWMQPRRTATQRLTAFELQVDPQAQLFYYADSYGNTVHHFDVPHPHRRLNIEAHAIVETEPRDLPDAVGPEEWSRLHSEAVRGEFWDFLRLHGFVIHTPALTAFIAERGLDALRRNDPLSAVRALNGAIYKAFDYEAGVTNAESPIDHALTGGRGVCQDFAHILIAVCRGWGIPARYVSGYLFSRREGGERSDPGATHAWVEVFLPSLRWVGFDPTNNVATGERHVAVAIGRDYADVPPSRGVFKGEAESRLSVGVQVTEAAAAPTQREFLRMGAPAIAAARRRANTAARLEQHHQQ